MVKNTKLISILSSAIIFALTVSAWANGGNFPDFPLSVGPESWKHEIQGKFTAKYVPFAFEPMKFRIEIVLWAYMIENQEIKIIENTYDFVKPIQGDSKKLCDYTEPYLIKRYADMAITLGVVDDFNSLGAQMQGFPILKEMEILKKTNCGDPTDTIISGKLKIEIISPQP